MRLLLPAQEARQRLERELRDVHHGAAALCTVGAILFVEAGLRSRALMDGLFSGTDESAGDVVVKPDGSRVQLFYGMSSGVAMLKI
jgi:IMP dehydrogenase/GMP reductase